MNDPQGKKKRHIRSIEQFFFKCAVISSMIPSDSYIKYPDPCNENHNTWYNPWNPAKVHDESVFDIMNKSMPTYIERIELYMKACGNTSFIDSESNVEEETNQFLHYRNLLLSNLSDLSYLSGLPL